MKETDVERRIKLLERWEYTCIVCGLGFRDISSVTVEHLVPRALGGSRRSLDNQAPTHYRCNQLRKTLSLCKAARRVRRKRKMMGARAFEDWVNAPVPGRKIPAALLAVNVKREPRP